MSPCPPLIIIRVCPLLINPHVRGRLFREDSGKTLQGIPWPIGRGGLINPMLALYGKIVTIHENPWSFGSNSFLWRRLEKSKCQSWPWRLQDDCAAKSGAENLLRLWQTAGGSLLVSGCYFLCKSYRKFTHKNNANWCNMMQLGSPKTQDWVKWVVLKTPFENADPNHKSS